MGKHSSTPVYIEYFFPTFSPYLQVDRCRNHAYGKKLSPGMEGFSTADIHKEYTCPAVTACVPFRDAKAPPATKGGGRISRIHPEAYQ